jgi:hypothetical protein
MSQDSDRISHNAQPDPVSPELVLVDPELAVVARERLSENLSGPRRADEHPGAGTTAPERRRRRQAPLSALPAPSRSIELQASEMDSDDGFHPVRARRFQGRRPLRRRLLRVMLVVVVVCLAAPLGFFAQRLLQRPSAPAGALELSARGNDVTTLPPVEPQATRKASTGAASTRAGTRAARQARRRNTSPSASARQRRGSSTGRAAAAAQTFVWVPVPKATHYNVLFFRGRKKIYQAWPTKPRLQVPLRGVLNGRRFAFVPGRYTWRVQPGFGPRSQRKYGQPIVVSTWRVGQVAER